MLQEILSFQLLGNPLWNYLLVFFIFVVGIFAIRTVLRGLVLRTLAGWFSKLSGIPGNTPIQLVERYLIPLLYLALIYVCLSSLNLATVLRQTLDILATVVGTYLGINLLSASVEYALRIYLMRKKGDATTEQSLLLLSPLIRVVFTLIGILFLLENLGFDVAALVASLGIGGIAIALAAQGVLQDLFAYISILMDRPFEIGDFIIFGRFYGIHRVHRHQNHAPTQLGRRADRDGQYRYHRIPNSQLQTYAAAAGGFWLWRCLRNSPRKAAGHSNLGETNYRSRAQRPI
jgi:small-conductance mechanosensitive channel